MTNAERLILSAHRAGQPVTPAMTVATIHTLEELDAYRKGLSGRGALTADAMAAIRDRQDEIRQGRG
jgi:hypothetical protein